MQELDSTAPRRIDPVFQVSGLTSTKVEKDTMKTRYLVMVGILAYSWLISNAVAIEVDFIEAADGTVTIRFNSGDWLESLAVGNVEIGGFNGTLAGNLGNSPDGGYNYLLLEFDGGPLSDDFNVHWFMDPLFPNRTMFEMLLVSDTEGRPLTVPTVGQNTFAVETGTLQKFQVPNTGIPTGLTIGIQSDLESVPDGGGTILTLGLALASISICSRFQDSSLVSGKRDS
jgi:hypothetical protein